MTIKIKARGKQNETSSLNSCGTTNVLCDGFTVSEDPDTIKEGSLGIYAEQSNWNLHQSPRIHDGVDKVGGY